MPSTTARLPNEVTPHQILEKEGKNVLIHDVTA